MTLIPGPRRESGSCSLVEVEEHIFVEGTYVSCSLFSFISPVSFLPFGPQHCPRLLPLSSGAAPPSRTSSRGLVQTRLLSNSPDETVPSSAAAQTSRAIQGLPPTALWERGACGTFWAASTHSPNGASDQAPKLDKKSMEKQPLHTETLSALRARTVPSGEGRIRLPMPSLAPPAGRSWRPGNGHLSSWVIWFQL